MRFRSWLARNAVAIVLLLSVCSSGAAVYAVIQVQAQRSAAILRACRDQNSRHASTIKELDSVLSAARRGASPAKRRELNANRAPTVLLIDALAPYQNCQKLLAKSTSTK